MAAIYHLHKNYYTRVVFAIFLLHLVYYAVAAGTNINNVNDGLSMHLIRKNSPNSPLYKHRNNNVVQRLMDPDTPQLPVLLNPLNNEHLMKFSIGTPPFEIYANLDSGSTLLWTQCQPCPSCYKMKYDMFDPKKSLTYRNISCAARECRLVDDFSPQKDCKLFPEVCIYNYTYADFSNTVGVLAKEAITLTTASGKAVTLKDIIIGCGHNNTGSALTENEMGVIGLGGGPLSFVSQIAPYVGGKKFSHCLVPQGTDPKIESKINFGNGSEVLGENVVSIPLIEMESREFLYTVRVKGISIGDEFFSFNPIGSSLENGTMVIDSGSPVTFIPQDLFDRLVTHMKKTLDPKLEPFIFTESNISISVFCIKGTIPEELNVTIHFEGDNNLQFRGEQIFFPDEVGTACFGMANTTSSGVTEDTFGVYGNNLMGNFLVGYDLDRNVVSFKPANCIN